MLVARWEVHAVVTVRGAGPGLWHRGVLPWRHLQAPAPKGESTLSQGGRTSSVNKHHSPCLHGASSKASLAVPGAGPAKRLCTVRDLAKKRGLQFET